MTFKIFLATKTGHIFKHSMNINLRSTHINMDKYFEIIRIWVNLNMNKYLKSS